MGTIFIAGVYGVGKSTLCHELTYHSNIPSYSAGDIISAVNGEKYGSNKIVANKNKNQSILSTEVKKLLQVNPTIILAGHFCIFNKQGQVDCLPEDIFFELDIEKILLLTAGIERICENLYQRDGINYSKDQIVNLQNTEQSLAEKTSVILECPLYIHEMKFNSSDYQDVLFLIKEKLQ